MPERKKFLSRRDFLKVAGATGVGIGLYLFDRLFSSFEEHKKVAILRSSVPLYDDKDSWFEGTGFLVEQDGVLSIATVQHVAAYAVSYPSHALISGYPDRRLQLGKPIERFNVDDPLVGDDDERIIRFPLATIDGVWVSKLIAERILTPLQWMNGEITKGQTVVIPDARRSTYNQGVVGNTVYDDLVIYLEAGFVCKGHSGSPVILVNNGLITNQVIAVVSKTSNTHYSGNLFPTCGDTVSAERK